VAGVGAEGEVEERVEHGGGVNRPLHHRDVGFAQGDEGVQRQPRHGAPVGKGVVHVEQLEGRAAGLEDEDEEEGNQGEPEVGGAETTGAAAGGLDEQREPGDDQENDREHEGEEEAGQVEVDVGRLPGGHLAPGDGLVHADRGVLRAAGDDVLVGVVLPGSDGREEGGGSREQGREEPDEGDVDGVGPGPGHVLTLSPLGIFDKKMPGQKQNGQGQKEQQTVVEISVTDAELQPEIPREVDDLRVEGEGDAETRQ